MTIFSAVLAIAPDAVMLDRVLFIGTQFSILYTSMYSPAGAASPSTGARAPAVLAPAPDADMLADADAVLAGDTCCSLVLNSVTSTPQWIRQPKPVVVMLADSCVSAVLAGASLAVVLAHLARALTVCSSAVSSSPFSPHLPPPPLRPSFPRRHIFVRGQNRIQMVDLHERRWPSWSKASV